jgi:hypothetical protein
MPHGGHWKSPNSSSTSCAPRFGPTVCGGLAPTASFGSAAGGRGNVRQLIAFRLVEVHARGSTAGGDEENDQKRQKTFHEVSPISRVRIFANRNAALRPVFPPPGQIQ